MFDRKYIDEYESGGSLLRQSIAGLDSASMHAYPVAGTWSIHEIVIHMMDSDLIGIDRMKRIAAEDNPLLIGYNETKFIQKLQPKLQSAEIAIEIFDLSRKLFANVLRALPDESFERTGIHNEIGLVKLGEQVKKYHDHLTHHLKFIKQKRELLKK